LVGVSATSRVDVTAAACRVAKRAAELIEPKLP
jgi:hypothetical protein